MQGYVVKPSGAEGGEDWLDSSQIPERDRREVYNCDGMPS